MAKHYLLYGSERYALAILRPLQDAIRARGGETAWFFDGPGAEDLVEGERLLSVREVRQWKPIAVITPGNHLPHFFPGVKVEVFHGFNAGKPRHIYIRGFFDLYCTTGPRDTKAFGELAQKLGHFTVTETGWPKLDPFMREISGPLPPVRKPPVILYHSTFSPSWSAAETLYEEVKRLSRAGHWHWIVSFHPKMDPNTVAKYKALQNDYLTFAENDNILELFPQVDMMCSDTSSALSEFLLTGKPVVTFNNRAPGPQLIDIHAASEFEPAIRRALSRPPELMQAIKAFGEAIHPYHDGRSSERVVDAIDAFIAKGGRNRKAKPGNWWRKLKLRKRIGYWGPA
ncbi:CDP-glycerol glycerophosphotransferase family protein [Dyella sp.]|uniref:CDP-glycerol glycerophosphotransferase family protein n=1 Tax=Dyella sp. TaxID=1869338 RepID=UPI002B45FAE7|nr:CDP-glycerol glycerophosphotransferase family protein [Dyella sp.]HKT29467.1 CDP-glycerol glycerophosphotransferase family protein [Dyella sp.]